MSVLCEPFRDALSALADGEIAVVDDEEVRAHVASCADCAAFAAANDQLTRQLRIMPAEAVPDLTAAILAAVPTPNLRRIRVHVGQLRTVLAMAGVVKLAMAAVGLASTPLGIHASREAGIFELALAVGFLVVARRPARASGLLPVAVVAAALGTVTGLSDIAAGATSWVAETAHLVEVVGAYALWALHRHRGSPTLHLAAA